MILTDWFWPGYKAGGPITSLRNMVDALRDVNFIVLTTDRDLNTDSPYPGIELNTWVDYQDHVKVMYLTPDRLTKRNLSEIIEGVNADVYYMNSMFSRHFTLVPLMILRKSGKADRIILAPRGMLKPGALSVKPWKKKVFLTLANSLSLYRGIAWHATSEEEAEEIRAFAGGEASVHLAPNISREADAKGSIIKSPGQLSILTVSRISPEKGIAEAISIVADKGLAHLNIRWTIAGNISDSAYAKSCTESTMPPNVTVHWSGEVEPGSIPHLIAEHHVFLSVTRGENFGHAIIEALGGGRPAIISNTTPWRELARERAGFDIDPANGHGFVEAIRCFGEMDQSEYDLWSRAAGKFAQAKISMQDGLGGTRRMFGLQ